MVVDTRGGLYNYGIITKKKGVEDEKLIEELVNVTLEFEQEKMEDDTMRKLLDHQVFVLIEVDVKSVKYPDRNRLNSSFYIKE